MKLKQIDFDASKIGQEGIVVKYRNGATPDFVKVYDDYITSVDAQGQSSFHCKVDGKMTGESWDLLMYQQVNTMSVDEWRDVQINIVIAEHQKMSQDFRLGLISAYDLCAKQLAAAIKNGEVEI